MSRVHGSLSNWPCLGQMSVSWSGKSGHPHRTLWYIVSFGRGIVHGGGNQGTVTRPRRMDIRGKIASITSLQGRLGGGRESGERRKKERNRGKEKRREPNRQRQTMSLSKKLEYFLALISYHLKRKNPE